MDSVQRIDTPKGEIMAVMPWGYYERLVALIGDDEDEADIQEADAIMARVKSGDEPLVPGEVVRKVHVGGLHIVRAWREHLGMTAEKLANRAGLTRAYLTQIEGGKRKGSVATYRKIAKALGTTVDALL